MLFDKLLNALKLKEPEDNNYDISTTADTPLQESDIPITTDAIDSSPESEEECEEETVPVLVLQSQSPSNIPVQATLTENTALNTTEQIPPLSNGNLKCKSLMQPENNFEPQPDVSNDINCMHEVEPIEYHSNRFMINGVHLFFIDIAREIVLAQKINTIPLMREYSLSEKELKGIIDEIKIAGIIDENNAVRLSSEELEYFIDIYEPGLFDCQHTLFNKDIFMCIGEIIFSDGFESVYDSLRPDELIDYLNIMEHLGIIEYDSTLNTYEITCTKAEFDHICAQIPAPIFDDYCDFDALSGLEFEKYCAELLSLNGFQNVNLTKSSGDHGIDILAEKHGITYAIQCKCYSNTVGNAAVQQALSGKKIYNCDIAVVLTNRLFTPQAKEEANILGVKLWDRYILKELCDGKFSS